MALICERGHRPPRDNRTPRCKALIGRKQECGLTFHEEPEVERCQYCLRGIYAGDPPACSRCGAERLSADVEPTSGQ